MSSGWMPESLVGKHTRGGQWVQVTDQITFHNNRRVVSIEFGRDRSLEFDVEDDAKLMEEIAEALLKVLSDVMLAKKALEVAAAKAALQVEEVAA
jgi:hypothetical protein